MSLPKKTRHNGTLFAIVFVHQAGVSPWQDPKQVHLVAQLTTYMLPKPPEVSLISAEDGQAEDHSAKVSELRAVRQCLTVEPYTGSSTMSTAHCSVSK